MSLTETDRINLLMMKVMVTVCSPAPAPAPATVRSGQTRSERLTALLSVHCSSRSTWLANSTTFGRLPVSAVSGTDAASLPTALKPTECPRPASAIGPASNRSVVLPFISSGTRLDQKCFFTSYTELARTGVQGALPDVRSGGGPVPSQYLFS
ncbi:hypothetical protein J6590_073629 [Homalodisca vitripennis]|nr:hypothetical protein J6590_073629 [Homalodisca vitripennis]